jgi:DNA-binding NtrC family response regulator
VRQLENAVFRAVVLADSDEIGAAEFPQIAVALGRPAEPLAATFPLAVAHSGPMAALELPAIGDEMPLLPASTGALSGMSQLGLLDAAGEMRPLEELEDEVIRFAIAHYRGQMSEVARRLKIGRSTLYRKLDEATADDPADGGTDTTN